MNKSQRQVLADRLDELGRHISYLIDSIDDLEGMLGRKKARLKALLEEEKELKEGVDW